MEKECLEREVAATESFVAGIIKTDLP